jgi:hypothetical protein
MDRDRDDTKGQGRKWTETQMDRDTDGQGLRHRRTVTGTQTDHNRDTGGQGQGHRRTETGTPTDRDRTPTDRKRERDIDGQREGQGQI